MEEEKRRHALTIIHSIRRLRLLLNRGMGKRLAQSGINLPQFDAMALLEPLGETTMSILTDKLGTTMGAVTNLIDKLVYAGYVSRKRNEKDRRIVNIVLTDAGRSVVAEHHDWGIGSLAHFLSRMTPQEQRTFVETFGDLVDYIDKDLARQGYASD